MREPMSKIKSIQLNNFKFFRESEPIVLDGKHLLLYGENGSGKSSIYWGIYTLLEAAFKQQPQIEQYFKPLSESDASLVNIYAQPDSTTGKYDSYIKLTLDDGKELLLSANDMSIKGDSYVQETRRMSDFLNYQSLFAFQQFHHGQENDLFDIFNYSILPYVSFRQIKVPSKQLERGNTLYSVPGKILSNAIDIWNEIRNVGPGKIVNSSGKFILVYKNSQNYLDFEVMVNRFNADFHKLVDEINSKSIEILKKIGYPELRVELQYQDVKIKKNDTWIYYTDYRILFSVKIVKDGNEYLINKPNSFLNEARLSAIALAIRFAVLDRTYFDDLTKLHLLVLDDIMISLDMGNRDRILDILLDEYSSKYHILFFTHDKNLYQFTDYKIKQHGKTTKWCNKEIYIREDDTNRIPIIIDDELDSLEKAKRYYYANDYVACSIYIRKSLEEYVKSVLPKELCEDSSGKFKELNKLWGTLCKYTQSIPEKLKEKYSQSNLWVLNASVHYQKLSLPIFRRELSDAIQLVEELRDIKLDIKVLLIKEETKLTFKHPTKDYSFAFTLKQDMVKVKNDDPLCIINSWQYNGKEYYDFIKNESGNRPTKGLETKFSKIKENLKKIPVLNITDEMFLNNTTLSFGTLKEAIEE